MKNKRARALLVELLYNEVSTHTPAPIILPLTSFLSLSLALSLSLFSPLFPSQAHALLYRGDSERTGTPPFPRSLVS